jgi:hypothetical protein
MRKVALDKVEETREEYMEKDYYKYKIPSSKASNY